MDKELDLRDLVCPEPVLRTKKVFDDPEVKTVKALVASEVNVENLKRLARSLGINCAVENKDHDYLVVLSREKIGKVGPALEKAAKAPSADNEVGTVVLLTREEFGSGELDFSKSLLNVFLQTVLTSGFKPRAVLLANSGVKLMHPDQPTYKVLSDLKESGVDVLACGLCVEFYGLADHIPKEQVTNMFAICEYLFAANKVLQP